MMLSSTFLASSLLFCLSSASLQIISGATWTAAGTNQHVQAHGGSVTKVGSLYYLIGENKLAGSAFQSINCYSSPDLVQWTFVNKLLTVGSSGDLGPNRVIERPKVLYNDATKKYVMWMHVDSSDYGEAKAGVATSDSICGSYTYIRSVQPLGFQSRDMGLYKDTDGSGYLLTEDRQNGLRINRLSSDYLTVQSNVHKWAEKYEAPAVYKNGNVYFMFASKLTGWDPNDNLYSTATSLRGPWSSWRTFAPSGTNTYSSQTTFVTSINGVVMYMGDRWVSSNLMRSTYVWLPLQLSGTTASMTNQVNWVLNIGSGSWTPGPTESTPEAESSSNTRTNGAVVNTCGNCSGGKSVGYIGGSPGGTLTFPNVSSNTGGWTSIRVHSTNGDSSQRYASVLVNGQAHTLAFCPSPDGNSPAASVLNVNLNQGGGNVVKFQAYNGGWVADIDRMMVPVS